MRCLAHGHRAVDVDIRIDDGPVAIHALDPRPAGAPVDRVKSGRRLDEASDIVGDEARDAVRNDLGHGAAREPEHRGAARHRLRHDNAERLLPQDRHEKAPRAAE